MKFPCFLTRKKKFLVLLDVVLEQELLFFTLKNISDQPVFNVSVHFDQPIFALGGQKEISELNVFKRTPFLAPQKEIKIFIDFISNFSKNNSTTWINVRIRYYDWKAKLHEHTITHNIAIYQELIRTH